MLFLHAPLESCSVFCLLQVNECTMRRVNRVSPMFRRLSLVALSVCLHTLVFPPWGISGLGWVALVPFLHAILGLRPAVGFLYGLLWGTGAIWGLGYWVPLALSSYWQQPFWFGILFSFGASIVFWGSYFGGFAACACRVGARYDGFARALIISVLWVSWELARAHLLTGDPWLLLGYSLVPHLTFIQAADLGGVYLLSFLVVFVNASLTEALRVRARGLVQVVHMLVPGAAAMAAIFVYGTVRLAAPPSGDSEFSVLIVQAGSDPGRQWREEFHGESLRRYLDMSANASAETPPQLIVWPESAVTFFVTREPVYRAHIARTLKSTGADLILGGPHVEDPDPARPLYFNSAFYMTSDGRLSGRYDKAHLLPFGEYFPLRTIDLLRRRFERVRYFTPGDGKTLLETRFGKIAAVICFEGIFPGLVRRMIANGATVLVNLSNDSWLGNGAGPEQHMAMITLRAVENRTWVIRATTTGVSAIIDPLGRLRARSGISTPAILQAQVAPMRVETVYQRYGDFFAYACLFASAATFIALAFRAKPANSVARP